MKKILLSTGIFPPEIGGPAQYAKNLTEALERAGHQVKVATHRIEKKLPTGVRHLYFLIKILPQMVRADFCIALDTFSVGVPAMVAGVLLRKKVIIRTGGDFLWEQYVERTGNKVLLRNFYQTEMGNLSLKEKIIFKLTKWALARASVIAYSTEWQRGIWEMPYGIDLKKTAIIENYYGIKDASFVIARSGGDEAISRDRHGLRPRDGDGGAKVFIAGTRKLKWKNLDTLENAFSMARERNKELILDLEQAPYEEFLEKIRRGYAVILVSLGDISPNMILDAIRLGKPFILTKETGLYERLKDVGIFVDPLDEQEITEKITWLADEKNYAKVKKEVENFNFSHSWDQIADEFMRLVTNY